MNYLPLLDLVEDLVDHTVFVGHLTDFDEAHAAEVRRLMEEIRQRQQDFREAFLQKRRDIMEVLRLWL